MNTTTLSRSAQLLSAGQRALERGDLDNAERFLEALRHEGSEADFRALAEAFLHTAAG